MTGVKWQVEVFYSAWFCYDTQGTKAVILNLYPHMLLIIWIVLLFFYLICFPSSNTSDTTFAKAWAVVLFL